MKLDVTVMKEDDRCLFFIDDFSDDRIALSGLPLSFCQQSWFAIDKGKQVFDLPLEDAKKMAYEILNL